MRRHAVAAILIAATVLSVGVGAGVGRAAEASNGIVAYTTGAGIEISNLDGRGRRVLTRVRAGGLTFSPDGSALAAIDGGDAYVIRLATGAAQRVASQRHAVHAPVWSPDGTKLALGWAARDWCSGRAAARGMLIASTSGGGPRAVAVERFRLPPSPAVVFEPRGWSPDGRRLLYAEEVWHAGRDCGFYLGDNLRARFLFHVPVSGGRPTRIAVAASGPTAWSPGGSSIAYADCGVVIARRDGRPERRWDESNTAEGCSSTAGRWLAWSHSGDEVFAATGQSVIALRVRDGRKRVLMRGPGLGCSENFNCSNVIVAVSRSGDRLAILAHGGTIDEKRLFVVATDGSGSRRLPLPRAEPFALWMP